MDVELIAPGQPNVKAGVINVQNNGAIYLFGAEAAQVHSKQIDSPTLRLTPGRPFLLRAVVLASGSVLTPVVSATVGRNGVPAGTVTLTGPAVLTGSYDPTNNATMFSGVVPGSWVMPGMQISINVATAPAMQLTFSPSVGEPTNLHVVLVPIQIGTSVGVPPSSATLQDALARTWPVARENITVETRGAMPVSVSTPVMSDQMRQINLNLHQRQLNERTKVFYGVIPRALLPQSGPRTTGMALSIPDLANQSTWLMSASGYDDPLSFSTLDRFGLSWSEQMRTLLHELGHLHSRRHAPCGSVAGPDPNYPYKDSVPGALLPEGPGRIGPEALYSSTYADSSPGAVAAPNLPASPPPMLGLVGNARLADLMGYCESSWFSSYNYEHVQKFLENRAAAARAAAAKASFTAVPADATDKRDRSYLVLSGLITEEGVTLAPAQVLLDPPVPPHASGPYAMTIRTKAGETINVNFTAPDVGDGDAKSFTVAVPNPGQVQSVEVSRAMRAIPFAKAITRARAQSANVRKAFTVPSAVTWTLDGEHVTVRWNAEAEPFLAVALVYSDGRKELVASELTGGEARVAIGRLPSGGYVELTVGSEFGARTLRAN